MIVAFFLHCATVSESRSFWWDVLVRRADLRTSISREFRDLVKQDIGKTGFDCHQHPIGLVADYFASVKRKPHQTNNEVPKFLSRLCVLNAQLALIV